MLELECKKLVQKWGKYGSRKKLKVSVSKLCFSSHGLLNCFGKFQALKQPTLQQPLSQHRHAREVKRHHDIDCRDKTDVLRLHEMVENRLVAKAIKP